MKEVFICLRISLRQWSTNFLLFVQKSVSNNSFPSSIVTFFSLKELVQWNLYVAVQVILIPGGRLCGLVDRARDRDLNSIPRSVAVLCVTLAKSLYLCASISQCVKWGSWHCDDLSKALERFPAPASSGAKGQTWDLN